MDEIEKKMNELKNSFYESNNKNIFFKNKQKLQCNQLIANNIDLTSVLQISIFNKKETNKIIVAYPILKNFATTSNIETIIYHLFDIIRQTIHTWNNFELHINMDTYTMTAHERFKHMFEILYNMNEQNGNIVFSDELNKLIIYNAPSVMVTLQPFFIGISKNKVTDKVFMYSKKETKDSFEKLIK